MNANAGKSLKVGNREWRGPAQQARDVHERLKRHVMALLDATLRETWLPMGFRVLVVQSLPAIRREIKRRRPSLVGLADQVARLLEEAEPYRVFAKRSEAILALKLFEAELQSQGVAA